MSSQGRSRAVKPSLKQQQMQQQHKPRIPSRLSFSSLPPLPPLPSTSDFAKNPTLPSTTAKRSPSPSPTPLRKRARPTPRARNSSASKVSVEDALNSVGAFYIGWEQGKMDPAPLCCPVEKEKIKQRFGEAAVGWMSIPAQAQPLPSTTLPILPPLPLPTTIPSSTCTSCSVDIPQDFLSNFSPSYSPSPPSLYDSSASSISSSLSPSLPPTQIVYPFETSTETATTNDLIFSTDSPLSTADQTLALPSQQDDLTTLTLIPTIKVEDEGEEQTQWDSSMSEALWSGSDDGGFFASSSGESEASWVW